MSKSCYYPNGDTFPATTFSKGKVCDQSAAFSSCCISFESCMSNGLCRDDNGTALLYTREGCSDPTWQDAACPKICLWTSYLRSSTWPVVQVAPGSIQCASDSGGTKGNGTDIEIAFPGTELSTSGATAIIPATSTSSRSAISSGVTSSSTSGSSANTGTSTNVRPSSYENTGKPTASSSPSNSNKSLIVGTSVGIPLGLLVLALIAILIVFHRRTHARIRKLEQQQQHPQSVVNMTSNSNPGGAWMPELPVTHNYHPELDGRQGP